MWTWSIAAAGTKKDVIDAVNAHEPPTIDEASVDIAANGKATQKICAALHGLDAVPEERAALKAAVRARGGSKKEEDEVTAPAYEPKEIELPDTHRTKFDEAKADVLARLALIPDGDVCSVGVSGNDTHYKVTLRNLTAEAAEAAAVSKGEK